MNPFKGRHFQRDIILWAVRWYCKYGISYRELQEMLAERGVNVDHSTIYRWVQRYAPEMEKRLRWYWRNPSDLCPWHMDETGTVAKLAMRQPFVLFKGLTFQKLCLPGAFRPGDHHNKMLRP
ncbi:hypothetical protein OV599_25720, partial [Salmonella enterica subsp. enterica serovar 1,4,[5],12:i:-]|nr:hypothetical protein [Salmonella enterica subsp. enterica serovar 1,4,[5],12:i:-]